MAEVTLEDVTKIFHDGDEEIRAVDDLSLEIEDGEFLVLVGPSGCGKTTTLRMIAGLETPTEGRIRLGGEDITDRRPQDREIAMVFQSYALYPHMSVRQNMAFGLEESTSLSTDEIADRVERAAETLGIDDLLGRKPSDLSGGQQQRVALGRAIVRDPKAFLLDEPLANLDAKLRAEMRTELQTLQEDLESTTIYVTHDQTEAMTMSDRIAILNDGELQQVGTPMNCYHEPANLFVAGFIGEPSMNFLDTQLEDGRLVGEWFDYPLSEEILADVGGTTDLVLGIRPEDIRIHEEVDGKHAFPAVVEVVEPQGNENTVHLRFAGEPEGSNTVTATVDGMRALGGIETVGMEFPEEAIHVFDANTGQAVHTRILQNVDVIEQIGTA